MSVVVWCLPTHGCYRYVKRNLCLGDSNLFIIIHFYQIFRPHSSCSWWSSNTWTGGWMKEKMGEEICGGNRWNHGAEGECTLCLWKPAGAWLERSKGREFDASSHRDRRLGRIWMELKEKYGTSEPDRLFEDLASSSSSVNVYEETWN